MLFEMFNVIISWIAKWYKTGSSNKHRRIGFCITILLSILWGMYFIQTKQYWLTTNTVVGLLASIRGIINNK